MALGYTEDAARRVVELVLDGKVTEEDFTAIVGPLQAFIDTHGRIGVLEVLRSYGGFEPGTLWPGMRFDLKNMSHVSHVAVVSDSAWLSPVVRIVSAVTPITLRLFPLAEEAAARDWLVRSMAGQAARGAGSS